MRTLYVHGMGDKPNKWQIDIFREHNLDIYAIHLDYTKEPDAFEILRDFAKQKRIEFIVGHSHGGFLTYWLAEELGTPCLMLNPHHSLRLMDKMKPKTITQRASPLCLLVLGTDDDLVDPDRTALIFEKEAKKDDSKIIKTKMLNGIGHWFDDDTFSAMIRWALSEISQLKYLNTHKR